MRQRSHLTLMAMLSPYYILSGYASLHMSPMMRAPELTAIGWVQLINCTKAANMLLLVGEITYHSIVTKREEPFPIGVSVIGAPCLPPFLKFSFRKLIVTTQERISFLQNWYRRAWKRVVFQLHWKQDARRIEKVHLDFKTIVTRDTVAVI